MVQLTSEMDVTVTGVKMHTSEKFPELKEVWHSDLKKWVQHDMLGSGYFFLCKNVTNVLNLIEGLSYLRDPEGKLPYPPNAECFRNLKDREEAFKDIRATIAGFEIRYRPPTTEGQPFHLFIRDIFANGASCICEDIRCTTAKTKEVLMRPIWNEDGEMMMHPISVNKKRVALDLDKTLGKDEEYILPEAKRPTIDRVFKEGDEVLYKRENKVVTVKKVHYDNLPPYFTVTFEDGNERQTTADKLESIKVPPHRRK